MKRRVTQIATSFYAKARSLPQATVLALLLSVAGVAKGNPDSLPPGGVVAASPDFKSIFLASPSIAILSDKTLVASHDWSGPGMKQVTRTSIYQSSDHGKSWSHLSDINGQRWSTLFEHRGDLYLMGVDKSFGNIVIRRSTDGGRSWTTPLDSKSGLLLAGRFHTAPVPVLLHGDRLWRAFEESGSGKKRHFSAFLMSVPAEADLLEAANWRRSESLRFQPQWLNILHPEWSEGNAVAGPEGGVLNVLRLNSHPGKNDAWELAKGGQGIPRMEVAASIAVSGDGGALSFDPLKGFLHIPGGQSKFTIRRDAKTGLYWAILQKITRMDPSYQWAESPHHQRNVLVLMSSPDLRVWTERYTMLSYGAGEPMTKQNTTGFQYVDWQFDGNDIVALCRTAWNALNYHDANAITFHRLENFRSLRIEDSPPDLKTREPGDAKAHDALQ